CADRSYCLVQTHPFSVPHSYAGATVAPASSLSRNHAIIRSGGHFVHYQGPRFNKLFAATTHPMLSEECGAQTEQVVARSGNNRVEIALGRRLNLSRGRSRLGGV